jgi:AraC-like DNA-binding protein
VIFHKRVATGPLSEFVEYFWFYRDLALEHSIEKLLPNAAVELIIDLSPSPKKLYDRNDLTRYTECRRAWISGMQRQYIVIGVEWGSSMMGLHFRTGGAAPFFDFPISELTGSVIELDLIWKEEMRSLRDRLLQEAKVSRKFDLLEGYLMAKARGRFTADISVQEALRQLRSCPALGLKQLAMQIGLSQKELIARFDRRIGLTPKFTSRIFRFQKALAAIHRGAADDWADVAQQFGYYDQPHFIHDFREFAGMTPTEYARQRTPDPDYIVLR